MKPRRSRSRDRDRVRGVWGEPARTTTSVFAPFFARFARLFVWSSLLRRQMMKTPVPTKAITAAVTARFLKIQSWEAPRYPGGTLDATGGGGGGLMDSGSHGEEFKVSLRKDAAVVECSSMESAILVISFVILLRKGPTESLKKSSVMMPTELSLNWLTLLGTKERSPQERPALGRDVLSARDHLAHPSYRCILWLL